MFAPMIVEVAVIVLFNRSKVFMDTHLFDEHLGESNVRPATLEVSHHTVEDAVPI